MMLVFYLPWYKILRDVKTAYSNCILDSLYSDLHVVQCSVRLCWMNVWMNKLMLDISTLEVHFPILKI